MVIDKTTGRGCALSIASKTITRKLIAEGIVNKPIYRKPCKNRYDMLTVVEYGERLHVWSRRSGELADKPLWTPSFIDARIWERAVRRFRPCERLDKNIENCLLPEMEEYLQSIPDPELVSMTRDFLIERGVINTPISQRAGKTYYFSEDEIYSFDKKSEIFPYEKRIKRSLFKAECEACFNINTWRKAVSQFEVGMTLKECISIFLKTELVHSVPQDLPRIDRLVQYIAPPVFGRIPGNSNKFGFDYIRITVGLPRYQFNSWKTLQNEVKKYQSEIYERVIQKLTGNRQFKKCSVPISFLRLSNVMLLHDFSMEFIFELKKQKTATIFESEEA